MPLPSGQFLTSCKPATQLCGVAFVELFDELRSHALRRRFAPTAFIMKGLSITDPEVLADLKLIANEVLKNHPDARAQGVFVPLLKVATIQQNAALIGLIEARQQLDQGSLSRAVLADQGHAAPRSQVQVDVFQCRTAGPRIGETDVLEAHAITGLRALGQAASRRRNRLTEVDIQVGQIQPVLVQTTDGAETAAHSGLPLLEQHQVHGHLPQGDPPVYCIDHHPGVGQVKRSRAQQPEQKSPAVTAHRQAPVFGIQALEGVAVALEQQRREAEQLDLLDVTLMGEQCFDVVLPTGFRSTPGKQAERVAGKMRLGKEHRQRAEHQNQQRPRRKMHQQYGKADQRNEVLQQPQRFGHQCQWPCRGFPPDAHEFVVELGVFELRQRQGLGLLQNQGIDLLPQQHPQQRLLHGKPTLRCCQESQHAGFEQYIAQHRPQRCFARTGVQLHGSDHRIDDALAEPGGQRGQQAGDQRGDDQPDGQRSGGGPDQMHRAQGLVHERNETFENRHTLKNSSDRSNPHVGRPSYDHRFVENRKLIMKDAYNLQRFVDAQQPLFQQVLTELDAGQKRSHWMWFVFPQIQGLGRSDTARHYAITDLAEARAYLQHPVLGPRLEQCAGIIAPQVERSARQIFSSPDDMKLHSSMTLFSIAAPERPLFQQVLDTFFGGEQDAMTVRLLSR
ncbi:Uncharacterized protein ALO92_04433 [Pseudomonas congelans]|uniref:Calpastatin n=2 Tax=Pseudomonas congelans TaxID=200452 RepID=A0A0P9PNY8_9PSED|nr:Uncharacterized protein ALO92_04433 [Pseudomonas congelans]